MPFIAHSYTYRISCSRKMNKKLTSDNEHKQLPTAVPIKWRTYATFCGRRYANTGIIFELDFKRHR